MSKHYEASIPTQTLRPFPIQPMCQCHVGPQPLPAMERGISLPFSFWCPAFYYGYLPVQGTRPFAYTASRVGLPLGIGRTPGKLLAMGATSPGTAVVLKRGGECSPAERREVKTEGRCNNISRVEGWFRIALTALHLNVPFLFQDQPQKNLVLQGESKRWLCMALIGCLPMMSPRSLPPLQSPELFFILKRKFPF